MYFISVSHLFKFQCLIFCEIKASNINFRVNCVKYLGYAFYLLNFIFCITFSLSARLIFSARVFQSENIYFIHCFENLKITLKEICKWKVSNLVMMKLWKY